MSATQALPAGVSSRIELGISFGLWMSRQAENVSPRRVMHAWGVSRPTAYRWLAAFRHSTDAKRARCGRSATNMGVQAA